MAVKGCIEGPFSHTTATGLAHVLIGEDPFRTEYLWHKMYRANIYGGRRGIGDPRDERHRPGALGHQGQGPGHAGLEAAGRRASRSRCGPTPARSSAPRRPRPAIGPAGSPTRGSRPSSSAGTRWAGTPRPTSPWSARPAPASGHDLDLMIDAGLVYDAKTAIQRARAFEPYNLFWFEEPLLPDDYEGYAKLVGRQPLCGSPPARRKASASRSSSSWTSARSTWSRST